MLEYPADPKYSAIEESDMEYPQRLQDSQNDYPLAPEAMEIDGVRKSVPHLGKR